MGDSLLAYWRDRHGYQSFLYAIGTLFAISAAVHSIAFFIYGGPCRLGSHISLRITPPSGRTTTPTAP